MAKYTQYRLYITKFCRSGSQVNYASMAEFYLWDKNSNRLTSTIEYTADVSSTQEGAVQDLFDGNAGTKWHSAYSGSLASYTNWVKLSFTEPVEVYKYGIMPRNDSYHDYPYTFQFEASNDGENWDILDSQEELSTGWANGVTREFEIIPPCKIKYLVKAGDTYYNVTAEQLTALEITNLTAESFINYGNDAVPDGSLLLNLSNPKVLCWTDGDALPVVTATLTATPPPQNVISSAIDLTHKSITGIERMTANCKGDLIMAVSFDGKQTWKVWNGSEWSTLSEEFAGMNKETLEGITFEQWNLLYSGADSFHIRVSLLNVMQEVAEIYVDFAN